MPATKTNAAAEARVEITVPRGSEREDPNLFVGINGVNYLLPKGKKSSVPAAVAGELRRADRARDALDQTMDSLQRAAV